jgi:ubiquinone/menaquinone biosynthesis C-methylase UbiE
MKQDIYLKPSKLYDRVINPLTAGTRQVCMQIYPPRENMSVLDIGCGTGTQLVMYHQAGCRIFGVDSSPSMLEIARRKLGDKAELSLQDAVKINYPDQMFDLITMMFVIHEVPAPIRPAVLTECKRVIKPEGRLLLIDHYFGPYSFPGGYFHYIATQINQRLGGSEKYAHYRDFKVRGGLAPLISEAMYMIEKKVMTQGGTAAVFLLKP